MTSETQTVSEPVKEAVRHKRDTAQRLSQDKSLPHEVRDRFDIRYQCYQEILWLMDDPVTAEDIYG